MAETVPQKKGRTLEKNNAGMLAQTARQKGSRDDINVLLMEIFDNEENE